MHKPSNVTTTDRKQVLQSCRKVVFIRYAFFLSSSTNETGKEGVTSIDSVWTSKFADQGSGHAGRMAEHMSHGQTYNRKNIREHAGEIRRNADPRRLQMGVQDGQPAEQKRRQHDGD